jgi:hypothetical protein
VDRASGSSKAGIFGWLMKCATSYDSRIVTIGQLVLFSTQTGDAWLLDPGDRLAVRLARDGESEPVHIEETDTTFTIAWKGRYRIDGSAFLYSDLETGRTHDPWVPDRQAGPDSLIEKFQIFLANLFYCERF